MIARLAVLVALGGVAVGLEQSYPVELQVWLADIRWPVLHGAWMSLIQLSYAMFLVSFGVLIWQYTEKPRPLHAAQIVGLLGLLWALPKTFILPFTLNILCSRDADDCRCRRSRGLSDGLPRRAYRAARASGAQ